MGNLTQNKEKTQANQSQGAIADIQSRTASKIRTQGMVPNTIRKIQADKAAE